MDIMINIFGAGANHLSACTCTVFTGPIWSFTSRTAQYCIVPMPFHMKHTCPSTPVPQITSPTLSAHISATFTIQNKPTNLPPPPRTSSPFHMQLIPVPSRPPLAWDKPLRLTPTSSVIRSHPILALTHLPLLLRLLRSLVFAFPFKQLVASFYPSTPHASIYLLDHLFPLSLSLP